MNILCEWSSRQENMSFYEKIDVIRYFLPNYLSLFTQALYNYVIMKKQVANTNQDKGAFALPSTTQKGERWINLLKKLLPVGALVYPAEPIDPVRAIALPTKDSAEDPSMISVCYLSFYE